MRVPLAAEIVAARAAAGAVAADRPRRRHDGPGQAALEARSRRRSTGSPSGCRGLAAGLGDERQDDDGSDGGRDPRAARPARAQRLGREPHVGRRVGAARFARAPSSACSRSTRRALPEVARARTAARGLPRQPLPRPARPLRRAGARRRALARGGRAAARRRGARRERRRPAGRRRSPRRGRARSCSALDDPRHARPSLQHAADSKYCVRCGTPYDYAAAYVGHLGDYRCPGCGHARPPLDVVARDIELAGLEHASVRSRHAGGDAPRAPAGAGPLQRLQRPRRRVARARARRPLDDVAAGLERFGAAFGRFERIAIGDRRAADAADQEPGRRERGDPHARRGRLPASR